VRLLFEAMNVLSEACIVLIEVVKVLVKALRLRALSMPFKLTARLLIKSVRLLKRLFSEAVIVLVEAVRVWFRVSTSAPFGAL
jgi:hypothetical protein